MISVTCNLTNPESKLGPTPPDKLDGRSSTAAIGPMMSTATSVASVVALSGSLRAKSLNTAMLRMAVQCVPPGLSVRVYPGLGHLPLFNPDIADPGPRAVACLRRDIAAADGILIASPEYAHGVSGVLKNALDWMVASGVLVNKPIALWNAAPRSSHGLAALRETLVVMSAALVPVADLSLLIQSDPSGRQPINPDELAMIRALTAFRAEILLLGCLM